MIKRQDSEGASNNNSIGNLQRLKTVWEQTKDDREKEKYIESLKHFNSKLLQDEEI